MKLLVKEKKGYTFRLLDIEENKTYRAFQRDFEDLDFLIGSLLIVDNFNE